MLGTILARLPRRALGAIGAALGTLAWALGIRRRVARGNLALAFPDKPVPERERIARAAYRNAGRGVLELFAAAGLPLEELDRLLELDGVEALDAALAQKRGLVVASAHLGSWEMLAALATRRGFPLHLVTRVLRGASNRAIQRARARSGIIEIAPRGALTRGAAVLRGGGIVVNLLDQNMLPKRGVFVRFFGEWACTTPAASLMAMRTGAPVLTAVAVNLPGGRTRVSIRGPVPLPHGGSVGERIRAHTQALVDMLEGHIREHPEQWFWLHRRWKTRPLAEPAPVAPLRRAAAAIGGKRD